MASTVKPNILLFYNPPFCFHLQERHMSLMCVLKGWGNMTYHAWAAAVLSTPTLHWPATPAGDLECRVTGLGDGLWQPAAHDGNNPHDTTKRTAKNNTNTLGDIMIPCADQDLNESLRTTHTSWKGSYGDPGSDIASPIKLARLFSTGDFLARRPASGLLK